MRINKLGKIGSVVFGMCSGVVFAGPTIVNAPVDALYVPTGFDDNDNSEVVVAGMFPTSCYKVGPSEAKLNNATGEIEVFVNAYKYEGICAQVLTPFLQAVKLGILPSGEYTVRVKETQLFDTVSVGKSRTNNPDDFLYAPVENAKIDESGIAQKLVLEGTYPYTFVGCALIREVKVIHKKADIIEVLPVMDLINDERCIRDDNEFKVEYKLADKIFGKNLIHVRVLNGQSFNRLVNITK